MKLRVNGSLYEVLVSPETPLLWVIREHLKLTGTKFGCLKGLCGTCTLLVDGNPVRSCMTPVGSVLGREIITIEGIPRDHPVKRAWKEVGVPQCGYCQSGQIVQAYALLKRNPKPTREEVVKSMNGNLCRCGTYPRIVRAVMRASEMMR
ncbi:(2Fe-2S)-binding protein [Hydrogenivirga sp. 128-5-R1-1]|uniref:(2Fe-2S)-binding protein n=1 Tax=Hydrogenivirga sp. 128-5-R1-1 TaxID=392423 RepID=UPI00015F374E|nr:(2Fe-2S)-binding protein [Hydrogenivirga sp. 128-5-R1-1]EDP76398.1 (2Fe-2S)-binding protein [Hydrogenivirga sp. 128-5-R1-1]